MAHNPKLNIYTLQLSPKNDEMATFRDLFRCKYNADIHTSDDELFKLYFENFVNGLGDDDFRKDTKNKKVLGITNNSKDGSIFSLFSKNNSIIDGVIEGGKYGIRREYADTDNKSDKKIINENNAVLDKYYILIYTPLNSGFGFLLIQSYTEESIQDSLKDFIKSFYSCENEFNNIRIEPYVPHTIVEKYMKGSKISMFGFTTKTSIPSSMRNNIQVKGQTFEVEVKIKPLDSFLNPFSEETAQIYNEIGGKIFDGRPLNEGRGKAYVMDEKRRKAHYDIEEEIKKIRPTIYLEDEGIIIDEKTGLPNFKQIQKYCLGLLEEIKVEFNKNQNINEL